mgnify:CR=1 FL=1
MSIRSTLGVLSIALASATSALADIPPLWTALFNEPGTLQDGAVQIVTDDAGAAYVVGTSQVNGQLATQDLLALKYNADGSLAWSMRYDDPIGSQDIGADLALASDGNLVVAGRVHGFGAGSQFGVIKIDSSTGEIVWISAWDPASIDNPTSIAVDAEGGVFVAGESWGSEQSDFAVAKFNANGELEWEQIYAGPGQFLFAHDRIDDIAIDANGDVFVTGPSNTAAHADMVTIKYDGTTGDEIWFQRYSPSPASDISSHIRLTPDGDVVIAGYEFQSDRVFSAVKYDGVTGDQQWVWTHNLGLRELTTGLAIDQLGDVYITGSWDPDGDQSNNNYNSATFKIDGDTGAEIWLATYGTNGFNERETPSDVEIDTNGNVWITGGDEGALFVIQYDATNGAVIETEFVFPGANQFVGGNELTVDAAQNVYVVGGHRNYNTDETDVLVVKFPPQLEGGVSPADLNSDGLVNGADLAALLAQWNGVGEADINDDGVVDGTDLAQLLASWS